MNSYIITSSGVTVFFAEDSTQQTITKDHPRYADIAKLAAEGRFDEIREAIDVRSAVDKFIYASDNGRFSIEHGILTFDGDEIHTSLADRIVDMAVHGLDISAMEQFMINLFSNPSYRAVTELYSFLEAANLPITSDGHFLAYKKIRDDYTDVYTGTMDNSIGSVVSMQRNKVDENKDRTCSTGLHFCSFDYLREFSGQRVVVLKINPRDVVSIPSDYNNTKGRCCQYEVIRELEDYKHERIEGSFSSYGLDDDEFDDERDDCIACGEDEYHCVCDDFEIDEDDDYVGESEDDSFELSDDEIRDFVEMIAAFEGVSADIKVESELNGEDDNDAGTLEDDFVNFVDYIISSEDNTDDESDVSFEYESESESESDTVIKAFDMRNEITYTFDTVEEAHEETNVPIEYIRRVLKGQKGSSLGFTFNEVKRDSL